MGRLERRSLETSVSERGEKEVSWELHGGGVGLCMSGVENWFLIDVTLLEKKVAKSSAVREVGEGGGEGQRREEKVLKRVH